MAADGVAAIADLERGRVDGRGRAVYPPYGPVHLSFSTGDSGRIAVVVAGKDAVILKTISPPSMDEFDELVQEARRQAHKAGIKQSDIKVAVTEVRGHR